MSFTPIIPSAKFPTVGTKVSGVVLSIEESPVPEFDSRGRITGNKKDDDGNTLMQTDVTLSTDAGKIVLHTGGAIVYAIGRALGEIGADNLYIGDRLTVEYTGDGEPTAKGRNAPKQYAAVVEPSGAPVADAAPAKTAKA